ncbi:MAG TPA: hypothetical protein VD767_06385 [Thermomicrobiales bacterium]|nr:hypothetical protein [Thermomicrobiales bacterium]
MPASLFRFNITDGAATVSFVGPAHGLKVLAAACAKSPTTISDLFDDARRYDPEWIDEVRIGLMVFDEHNTGELSPGYEAIVAEPNDSDHRAFRVIDTVTRARSNQPARLGLVVVNLKEHRIIQVQNSYAELARKGRGRIRSNGTPTRTYFHYELPELWSIVP